MAPNRGLLHFQEANSFEWKILRMKHLRNNNLQTKSRTNPKRMKTLGNFGGREGV
jgi:hypothetical protein